MSVSKLTHRIGRLRLALLVAVAALVLVPAAGAAQWLPHTPDASWTYAWTDSAYSPTPTTEKVTVKSNSGKTFALQWTTDGLGNPASLPKSEGAMTFRDTASGPVNVDWSSTPPPPDFPVLCASEDQCSHSLAATLYLLIWGSRAPVVASTLTPGRTWKSVGGADGSVTSVSTYLGVEPVSVPAFPQPVLAAKVRSDVTQQGALGDPYGSGTRIVWWVYGVGPAKIVFEHAGGASAPVTTSVLKSTTLKPLPPPRYDLYFPLRKGASLTYSWTNTKHLTTPSVQRFTVDQVMNSSGRFAVKSVSGPIQVAAAYGFNAGPDGVVNLWALTHAALGQVKLPPLGPAAAPVDKRRHFSTPFDLMMFGFNPIVPADPTPGKTWAAAARGRDFSIYGVRGTSKVLGVVPVTVPAGRFSALEVQTALTQPGFPFGSGTRTSWFAPGKGLVKLVFRHGDGSVSTVQLVR